MECNMTSDGPIAKRRKMDIPDFLELNLREDKGMFEEQQPDNESCEMKRLFNEMLNSQFTDVKLKCGSVEVSAHKSVLFGRIPFFKDALMYDAMGKTIIEVSPEITPEILRLIVQYGYFVHPKVSLENAQVLLEAAAFFRIEDLWAVCDQFIANRIVLTVENCMALLSYAAVHSAKFLTDKAYLFIAEHLDVVSDTDAFKCMNEKEIASCLKVKDLEVLPDEGMFWEALVKWIEADVEDRKPLLPNLLRLLRLPCLGEHFINSKVLSHPYVEGDSVCREMINDLLLYKADPSNMIIRQRCEAAFDSMKQRCKKVDHLYYFYACREHDGNHCRNQVLRSPDGDWSKKAWKDFPESFVSGFDKMVTVKYDVYCFDNRHTGSKLHCCNYITKTWTVIEGDEGRPELAEASLACVNGKLVAVGSRIVDGYYQTLLYSYDPSTNSWSETELEWPNDIEGDLITFCFGVKTGNNEDEWLCVVYHGINYLVLLFDVNTGDLIQYGRNNGVADTDDQCFPVTYGNGKVFIGVTLGYNAHDDEPYERCIKVYDVTLNKWSTLPGSNACIQNLVELAVANDRLYAIGQSGTNYEEGFGRIVKSLDLTDGSSDWQPAPDLLAEDCFFDSYDKCAVVCLLP